MAIHHSYKIGAGLNPSQGPKTMPHNFNFQTGPVTQIAMDILLDLQRGAMDYVQSLWIDNGLNPSPFSLQIDGTLQIVRAPPFSQGVVFFPIPQGNSKLIANSAGGIQVPVMFLNVAVPYYMVSVAGGTALPGNASGTITVGGTPQLLLPASTARRGFTLQNLSTDMLYFSDVIVNPGAGVAGSFELTPAGTGAGGAYSTPSWYPATGAVWITGANAGDVFSCVTA